MVHGTRLMLAATALTSMIATSICGCAARADSLEPAANPADVTNWALPGSGAKLAAGPNTQFLPGSDLSSFTAGNGLIFRHGLRGLEEVITIETPRPVLVRSVVVKTAYEDVVRVPIGFTVYASPNGDPAGYKPIASVDGIRADRTLVTPKTPITTRFLKLSFRDSGGGSRVSEIGVFSATPDVVKGALDGFVYQADKGWLSLKELAAMRKEYGGVGNAWFTMICGSVEYTAPPPPGQGTVWERYKKEQGTLWRKYVTVQKELPFYKAVGAGALEMYVRWNLIEDKPGKFDFSAYDAFLNLFKKNGLAWHPLVIAGPAYTLPEWYRKSPDHVPFRCLEHDRDNEVESIWNPKIRVYVDRFMREFIKHYDTKDGSLECLMLGVSGIFGENLYPHESDRDWTTNACGDYHSHSGWWAGDKYARESFRAYMQRRYTGLEALNTAWKTDYQSWDAVEPTAPQQCKTRRASYDFMSWYNDSMTEYTEFWLRTARKYRPKGAIQLCIGGEGRPRVGTDYSRSAQLAAKYKIGVRITNESPDYPLNVAMTRWISTATRFYGTWLGTEPASLQIAADSITQRIYNARTTGARELFCYQSGMANKSAYRKLMQDLPFLRQDSPNVSVAYWIPRTHMLAVGDVDYVSPMIALRGVTDFDAVDDHLITDGALSRYKVLVMSTGNVESAETLNRIVEWVEAGGVLIRTNPEPLTTIEGHTIHQSKLFGDPLSYETAQWSSAKRLGRGFTLFIPDAGRSREATREAMARLLPRIPELGDGYIAPSTVTGAPDVYGSLMKSEYLILNAGPSAATINYSFPVGLTRSTGTATLPPYSIRAIPYGASR